MNGRWISVLLILSIMTSFSLADEGAGSVRFAVIGDRTGTPVSGVYDQIVEQIERLKPEFVMTVGDMIEGPIEDSIKLKEAWDEYMGIVSSLSMPIHFVPGNNETENDLMNKYYLEHIGPLYYSFDYHGIHFVLLDNSRWRSSGDLPSEQMEWLINDLKDNQDAKYTLAFMHKPFWYHTTALGKPDTMHTLFRTLGVDAVFTGHFHEYFVGEYDGIFYTGMGSSGGGAGPGPTGIVFQFCWVTVDDDGITIAPIDKDAVRAWDDVTADDLRLITRMKNFGVESQKAMIDGDLKVGNQNISIKIKNFSNTQVFDDTLRWLIPEDWTVEPAIQTVQMEPGGTLEFNTAVACDGSLYPVPVIEFSYEYRDGKRTRIESPLLVTRNAKCLRATEEPKVDGKLDEDIWRDPTTALFSSSGGPARIDPTEFYFAYDEKNLYLAARCQETVMDSMVARAGERDGSVYQDDCIGYFFQPDIEAMLAYQIYISPAGTVYDVGLSMDEYGFVQGDRDWNGVYEIGTDKGEDYWSVEVAMPLDQFGAAGQSGKECGINFRRKQQRLKTSGDWQDLDFHPKTFGTMTME